MRVKWFGEAWPRDDYRAPICGDDADRADVPVGKTCIACSGLIEADDRGVVMAATPDVEGAWYEPRYTQVVCANHIDCFIGSVLPDMDIGFSRKASPVGSG